MSRFENHDERTIPDHIDRDSSVAVEDTHNLRVVTYKKTSWLKIFSAMIFAVVLLIALAAGYLVYTGNFDKAKNLVTSSSEQYSSDNKGEGENADNLALQ